MPLLTEETTPERRSRLGRSRWLLLVPLAALPLLLAAVTVRPFQVGPYVLASESFPAGQNRWHVQWVVTPGTVHPVELPGGFYVMDGSASALALECPGRIYTLGWFRGHRLQ